MTKICNKCGIEKDIDEFYLNQSNCKKCKSIINKKHYQKDAERIEYNKQYYLAHKKEKAEYDAKHKTKKKKPKKVFDTEIIISEMIFYKNMELLVKAYNRMKRSKRSL